MRVVVIGATGLIGRVVVAALEGKHDVVAVGHTTGDLRVDITDPKSIAAMYQSVGRFDALVSAAGVARFGSLEKLTDEDFEASLRDKLMGQVNLIRLGSTSVNDGGSLTLTSGVLAREPIPGSAAISLVNSGLEGFVRAAALELQGRVRVNIVSPPFAVETLRQLGMDESGGLPVARFARAYLQAVEGGMNGEILDVRAIDGARA